MLKKHCQNQLFSGSLTMSFFGLSNIWRLFLSFECMGPVQKKSPDPTPPNCDVFSGEMSKGFRKQSCATADFWDILMCPCSYHGAGRATYPPPGYMIHPCMIHLAFLPEKSKNCRSAHGWYTLLYDTLSQDSGKCKVYHPKCTRKQQAFRGHLECRIQWGRIRWAKM